MASTDELDPDSDAELVSDYDGPISRDSGFNLGPVFRGTESLAQRWAVLAPTVSPTQVDGTDKQVIAGLNNLVYRRRCRFNALRNRGWEAVRSGSRFVNVWSCPPCAVVCHPQRRPCELRLICPFCWAREYAWMLFRRLAYLFDEHDKQYREAVPNPDLLEVTITQDDYSPSAAEFWRAVRPTTGQLARSVGSLGAFVLNTAFPAPGDGWRHSQRALWVGLPGRWPDSLVTDVQSQWPESTIKLSSACQLTGLAAVVGRVCRYPRELLTADASRMVELLNAHSTEKVRVSEYYGELRTMARQQRQQERRIRYVQEAMLDEPAKASRKRRRFEL